MNTAINYKIFKEFPELESERLIFKDFSLADANDLFLIRSDDKVMNFMGSYNMSSIQDAEIMILSIQDTFSKRQGISWIIVEKCSGTVAGYFGFWRFIPEHCRAEIGYALKPEFWGKGFMTETLKRMIRFAFNDLQIHSIEANVKPGNNRSMALLKKTGFRKEAHFKENYLFDGKYYDSIIYTLTEKVTYNE